MENEENKEKTSQSTNDEEESLREPGNSFKQPFSGIDMGKSMVVVFMLTAAMCALIGFYFGIQYTTNEYNAQYQEFFDNHICIEGEPEPSGHTQFTIPTLDIGRVIEDD